jgi:peptidoglycan/LPS O-acetylase OafA/YrhL
MTTIVDRSDAAPTDRISVAEIVRRHGERPDRQTSVRRTGGSFRRDIQGLRAVAILLVVLYHSNVPGVTGGYVGVDVFFVISGFLITGQLVREHERNGYIELGSFYARRMRRLLPAAVLVVLTTVLVARYWGPVLQIRATATDAIYTLLYAINFHLAAEGIDYQQANGPVSPLQHFWSLAVEEQFYLVWPLLIVVGAVVGRGLRRWVIGLLVAAVTVVSLYWAIHLTTRSAPVAYFSVQTRAWEFGFGALVALGVGSLRLLPRPVSVLFGWLGLAAIVASALYYDETTPFPGTAAIVPVVGAAAVLVAGSAGGAGPLDGLLGRKPMQIVGRFSYSWYLWHWPMLVLMPALVGYPLSWVRQLEVSLLALWLAGLTYAAVEHLSTVRPLRRGWLLRGPLLSGVGVLACLAVLVSAPGVVGSGKFAPTLDLTSPASQALGQALVTAQSVREVPGNLTPTLTRAGKDVPVTEGNCHLSFTQTVSGPCVYGDQSSNRTVVVFGDSHAQQWDGALIAAAKAEHWRLVSWTKAACPAAEVVIDNPQLKRRYTECETWRAATIDRIAALNPALVIVSQSDSVPGKSLSSQAWADATVTSLGKLRAKGVENVVFLADTPYPGTDVPTCVSDHLDDVRQCGLQRNDAYHGESYYADRHQVMLSTVRAAGFSTVDPIDWMCSPQFCPVMVGNQLIYRDDSHITNTFSTTLAPMLSTLLVGAR